MRDHVRLQAGGTVDVPGQCDFTEHLDLIMPLSDASSAPLAGDAKPGILRVCDLKGTSVVSNRGPSDSVKTWLVLICVVGCAIQTATIVQLKRRIDEQEERVSTIEHVLSITGSPHARYAQASATQYGGQELSAPCRARVDRLKRDVPDVVSGFVPLSPQSDRVDGQRRTRRRRDQRRYVTRKELAEALASLNTIIDEDLHTSFHVVLLLDDSEDGDVTAPERVVPLRWTRHSHLAHTTGFELDPETSQTVEVTVSGTYFVYSQVTYNGRKAHRGVSQPPCSHIMMLKPYGRDASGQPKDHVKLMYSVTTQYDMGRRRVHAYDSVYQAGVFHLESGDRLYVRPDMRSVHCRFVVHPEKTFFGTFRLNPSLGTPSSQRK